MKKLADISSFENLGAQITVIHNGIWSNFRGMPPEFRGNFRHKLAKQALASTTDYDRKKFGQALIVLMEAIRDHADECLYFMRRWTEHSAGAGKRYDGVAHMSESTVEAIEGLLSQIRPIQAQMMKAEAVVDDFHWANKLAKRINKR